MLVAGVLGAHVALRDAGIVDQDVRRPELALDLGRDLVDLRRLGDVERHADGVDAQRRQLVDGTLDPVRQHLGHDDLGPGLAQRLRAGEADALAAAGDHGDPALEVVLLEVHGSGPLGLHGRQRRQRPVGGDAGAIVPDAGGEACRLREPRGP